MYKFKKLMSLFMITVMIILLSPSSMTNAASETKLDGVIATNGKITVLEIQPSTLFELTESSIATKLGVNASKIELIQMSMPLFIASTLSVTENYDVIYIGAKKAKTDTAIYTSPNTSTKTDKYYNFDRTYFGYIKTGVASTLTDWTKGQYFRDNDITLRKKLELEKFINSGQLVVFTKEIDTNTIKDGSFNIKATDIDSNLKKLYDQYLYSTPQNVKYVNDNSVFVNNVETYFESASTRASINIISQPNPYSGQGSEISTKFFEVIFKVSSRDAGKYTANLYLDVNSDGLYSDGERNVSNTKNYEVELIKTTTGIEVGNTYSMNMLIPDLFVGLVPWKLEIVNDVTGVSSSYMNYAAYKDDRAVTVRVLQIAPVNNTFKLSDKNGSVMDSTMKTLFNENPQYNFDIDWLTTTQFQAKYNDANYTLNGRYDMVIFGFADMYGSEDITNLKALSDIEKFINTGQSVMFTHDTTTFGPQNFSKMLTERFKSIMGQYRYTTNTQNKYNGSIEEIGYSHATIMRQRFDLFKPTTTTSKTNHGVLTLYPYILVGETLSVATTHNSYHQLDLEDPEVIPWYTLDSGDFDKYDARNNYYTYSKGSVTYSGTGHTSPNTSGSNAERKLFVNTIVKANSSANHAPSVVVKNAIVTGTTKTLQISDTVAEFDMEFKASDADFLDRLLGGQIWVDSNNNGKFDAGEKSIKLFNLNDPTTALRNDVFTIIEKIKTSDIFIGTAQTAELSIKAYDAKGAEIVYKLTLQKVAIPVFTAAIKPSGALEGDTIDFGATIEVTVSDKTTVTKVEDIKLTQTIKKVSFITLSTLFTRVAGAGNGFLVEDSGRAYAKLLPVNTISTLSNIKSLSWNKLIEDHKVIVNDGTASKYTVISTLDYKLRSDGSVTLVPGRISPESEFTIAKGKIDITTKTGNGSVISGASIVVKDKNGSVFASGVSNSLGKLIIEKGTITSNKAVTSGKYTVIATKDGNTTTTIVELDYLNPIGIVNAIFDTIKVSMKSVNILGNDVTTLYINDNDPFIATVSVSSIDLLEKFEIELIAKETAGTTALYSYQIKNDADKAKYEIVGNVLKSKVAMATNDIKVELIVTPLAQGLVERTITINPQIKNVISAGLPLNSTNIIGSVLTVIEDYKAPVITFTYNSAASTYNPINEDLKSNVVFAYFVKEVDSNPYQALKNYDMQDVVVSSTIKGLPNNKAASQNTKTVQYPMVKPSVPGYYVMIAVDEAGNISTYKILVIKNSFVPILT